ncbi:DUF4239 domain-containing protein [Legionella maioricensis]|uniref:DUF4239 domain-containing protein n=1 Tax=Legionella maioricensis TaxID=2896528 RepID=A0A9X2D392_9GAMM|nr:DUF4239 domain-containing protein [Legionella maioricensis]MCL9685706.1 DUF4239 domain-containing protein [Legionella maioricensis]MCL9689137.1 DUF4239 domain-containing protein [Legionella maioricensis]
MFRELINLLSVGEIFILSTILLISLSLVVSYIGSIFIKSESVSPEYTRDTDSILGVMGSGYGIFLGFVIITLWGHYMEVQKDVYEEAGAISSIVHNIKVFPQADAFFLRKNIAAYLQAIRDDEWQKMKQGKESNKAWDAFQKLYITFQQYTAKTAKETFFYGQIMNNMDTALKKRRDRLLAVKSIINNEIRIALILGAIVIIVLASFLKTKGPARIFANICLTIVIGFNLTLALCFDYPFSGSISISNYPFYEGVLANLKPLKEVE